MPASALHDPDTAIRRLKALGDDTRMAILLQLADGEQCVCDVIDALQANQSLMSFHLRILREAGLVTDRKVGRWVHYSINPAGVAELERFLQSLRRAANAAAPCSNSCCS